MIEVENYEEIGILKLNRGITNAINHELVKQLSGKLRMMKDNPDVHGIVLASSNDKFFAIGLDIPNLISLSREEFMSFYQSFNQLCIDLYTISKPTIAAITGHATAAGYILALCCDYRFIAEGRKLMGLNEIKLGVPVPYPADCILQNLVGAINAREITYTGDFYPPEASKKLGMVDEVILLDQVLERAIEKTKQLGSLSGEAFMKIKQNRIEVVKARILKKLTEKEQIFVDCWFSDETREQLNEAAKKF
ncbi:MAG: enoyl-CoA hydratase/isomerase family protein [Candidatus Hodarchaeales archaeon]|jgi:enoyl-CoA hydratase/carnithine racemase